MINRQETFEEYNKKRWSQIISGYLSYSTIRKHIDLEIKECKRFELDDKSNIEIKFYYEKLLKMKSMLDIIKTKKDDSK